MKTVKRLVVCLTCFVVLLSSFTFNYSAVEYDPYTGEEMIYDEADGSWYTPAAPLEFDPWSFFIRTSPLDPEFEINKLPWLDMPTYIQDILYGDYSGIGADVSYTGEVKLPFVLVIVHSSVIRVVAGWNLFIGSYCSNADLAAAQTPSNVFVSARKVTDNIYKNAVCYQAKYRRSDYSLSEAWKPLDAVTVGDKYVRYTSLDFNTDSRDFYCYGFNTNILGSVSSVDKVNSDSDWSKVYVVNDPKVGFQSGKFVYWPDSWSNTYFSAFTPPTQEQLQNETSKGIWQTLKELPGNIADSIKGFFTSLGDRINNFFTTLTNNIATMLSNFNKSIGDFFDKLRNYLLYFQEEEPEHVNPFDNLLTDVQDFFDEQMSNVSDFKNSMNTALENVVTYISSGSGVINKFFTALPLVTAFVTFFVVFFIVRKVIGR